VTGAAGHGIRAHHKGNRAATSANQNLTVTAANVSGSERGIFATNDAKTIYGSKTTNVNVNGIVTGGTGAGTQTQISNGTKANRMTNITLNAGAAVGSANGVAILDDESRSTITINDGAGVNGSIILGGGDDTVAVTGGQPQSKPTMAVPARCALAPPPQPRITHPDNWRPVDPGYLLGRSGCGKSARPAL
jgi:hypothetical protein